MAAEQTCENFGKCRQVAGLAETLEATDMAYRSGSAILSTVCALECPRITEVDADAGTASLASGLPGPLLPTEQPRWTLTEPPL